MNIVRVNNGYRVITEEPRLQSYCRHLFPIAATEATSGGNPSKLPINWLEKPERL
jgi:hypothetical protein